MMNKKKMLATVLAFLFVFGIASGCASSGENSNDSSGKESSYSQTEIVSEEQNDSSEVSKDWVETLAFSGDDGEGTVKFSEEEFCLVGGVQDGYFEYEYTFVGGCEKDVNGTYVCSPESVEYSEKYFGTIIREGVLDLSEISTSNVEFRFNKFDEDFYSITYAVGEEERAVGIAIDPHLMVIHRNGEAVLSLDRLMLERYGIIGYDMALPLNIPQEELFDYLTLVVVRQAAQYIHVYAPSELEIEINVDTSKLGETTAEIIYNGRTYTLSCYVFMDGEFGSGNDGGASRKEYYVMPSQGLAKYVEVGTTAEEYFGDTTWKIHNLETGEEWVYDGEYAVTDWDSSTTQIGMQYTVSFSYDGEEMRFNGDVNVCTDEEKDLAYTFWNDITIDGSLYQTVDVIYMPSGTDVETLRATVAYKTYGGEIVYDAECVVNAQQKRSPNGDIYLVEFSCAGYSEERIVHVISDTEAPFPLEAGIEGFYFDVDGGIAFSPADAYVKIIYSDGSTLEMSAEKGEYEKLIKWVRGIATKPYEEFGFGRYWFDQAAYWNGKVCGYHDVYGCFLFD